MVAGAVREAHSTGAGARDTLFVNTHRPVTNGRSNRRHDFRRVSHGATRFGRQTNHSDVDDHVSTIRVSQGQGQRVGQGSVFLL